MPLTSSLLIMLKKPNGIRLCLLCNFTMHVMLIFSVCGNIDYCWFPLAPDGSKVFVINRLVYLNSLIYIQHIGIKVKGV